MIENIGTPIEKSDLKRIAIVGAGHVGSTSALALLYRGIADEIVILDIDRRQQLGEVMDLQHSVPLTHATRIWAGDYEDLGHADILVVAAGVGTVPGQSRLDLLKGNIAVTREIVANAVESGFDGIVLMTTNPVDILAQISQEESGLSPSRIISSGTVLDTARLRALLAAKFEIDPGSVHAYVIGEHGSSEVAVFSSATIAGVPLREFAREFDVDFDSIHQQVINAAPEIVKNKGYTSAAIATSVVRICEAILRNEKSVLPVSTRTTGQYGISDVYLSLPCVVGRRGVERVIELPLDAKEREGLRASAAVLRDTLETVN